MENKENNQSHEIKRKVFLEGKTFGKLKVLSFDHYSKSKMQYYLCECECGNKKLVQSSHLLNGEVKSCGCIRGYRSKQPFRHHNLYRTRIHNIWNGMLNRCLNKNNPVYERYGGRGIKICDEWLDIEKFYKWAIENGYSDDLSIDRINNDGNYEPSNCRWADKYTQENNKGNVNKYFYKGKEYSIAQLSRISGIPYCTIFARLKKYGYTVEEAMVDIKNRNNRGGRK